MHHECKVNVIPVDAISCMHVQKARDGFEVTIDVARRSVCSGGIHAHFVICIVVEIVRIPGYTEDRAEIGNGRACLRAIG